MKRVLAVILILCLTVCLCTGCGSKDNGAQTKDGLTAEDFLTMQNAFDAVGIYTYYYDGAYEPMEDSFWKMMWIMVNVWGTNSTAVSLSAEGWTVPASVIDEYGAVLYSGYKKAPALPEETTIKYDEATDSYFVPLAEAWMVSTRYDKIEEADKNSYYVSSSLVDLSGTISEENPHGTTDGSAVLCTMRFEIKQSNDSEFFAFSIEGAERYAQE